MYECIADDIDCTLYFLYSFIRQSSRMNFQLETTLIRIKNIFRSELFDKWFHCFQKIIIFCNSMESSIVLLVNFVIFLETIRWNFLNVDIQLWGALNVGFKISYFFLRACKVHLCRSISWTLESIAAVNLSSVNLEM